MGTLRKFSQKNIGSFSVDSFFGDIVVNAKGPHEISRW